MGKSVYPIDRTFYVWEFFYKEEKGYEANQKNYFIVSGVAHGGNNLSAEGRGRIV